jgi:trigger factor
MRIKYIEALQKKEKARDPSAPASPQDHQENSLNFLDDKDKRELEENAYKQAVRQVKAFFILDKIADTEKIYLKHEELDKYIEEMAARYKKTREEIKDYLEKGHGLNELAVNLRNKKVVEFLLKEARIE